MGTLYNLNAQTVEPARLWALVEKERVARRLSYTGLVRIVRGISDDSGSAAGTLKRRINGPAAGPPPKSYAAAFVAWLNNLEPLPPDENPAQAALLARQTMADGSAASTDPIVLALEAIALELKHIHHDLQFLSAQPAKAASP